MKKITYFAVAAALVSTSVLGSITASAEEVANVKSNSRVTFQAGNETESPVDPLNPVNPVTPTDPTTPDGKPNPGTAGPLSIDFASSFQFGPNNISTQDKVYYALAQKYTDEKGVEQEGPNYVQVTDKRGTLAGWSLSVTQDKQFETSEAAVLEGAKITLLNASLISTTDAAYAPTALNKAELVPGQKKPIVSAAANQGMGTWVYRFGDDTATAKNSVSLFVPGKTVKRAEQYDAQLTWSLENIPTNVETEQAGGE